MKRRTKKIHLREGGVKCFLGIKMKNNDFADVVGEKDDSYIIREPGKEKTEWSGLINKLSLRKACFLRCLRWPTAGTDNTMSKSNKES